MKSRTFAWFTVMTLFARCVGEPGWTFGAVAGRARLTRPFVAAHLPQTRRG